MKTVFLRAVESDDERGGSACGNLGPDGALGRERFHVDVTSFLRAIPAPRHLAYWVSEGLRAALQEHTSVEADGRTTKQGLATADDFRFVREWWETPCSLLNGALVPVHKGGKFTVLW